MENTPVSKTSPTFLRARTIGFSITSLLAFLWAVLLCVDLYMLWAVMDTRQRSLVAILLAIQVLTVFTLLILLVIAFKPWLDSARMALLLIVHVGMATAFTVFRPTFHCYSVSNNSDAEGVCQITTILIIVGSWMVPVLLLVYVFGLAYMVHRRQKTMFSNSILDLEKAKQSRSSLPMMSEEFSYEEKRDLPTPQDHIRSHRNTWIPPTPTASRMSTTSHSRSKPKSRSSTKVSIDYTYGAQISPDPFRASTTPSQYHANDIYRAPPSNSGNDRRDTWISANPYRASKTPSQYHASDTYRAPSSNSANARRDTWISADPYRASKSPSQYHASDIYRAPSSNAGNARRDTWIPPDPYRASTAPSQFHANAGIRLSKPLPVATAW